MNDAYLKTSISYSHAFAGTYSQGTEWVDMDGYWSKQSGQDMDMVVSLTEGVPSVSDADLVGGDNGMVWFTATTVAQSFMATRSVLSSISFKAKGYTDTSRFTATVYPEMIVPGLREVTLVDFSDIGAQGIYDETYLVVEASTGRKWFIWFDYNGDGVWAAEPYVSKTLDDVVIRVNVAGLISDEAIALAFVAACKSSLEIYGFILTNNGDGTVSITHDAEGLVPHVAGFAANGNPLQNLPATIGITITIHGCGETFVTTSPVVAVTQMAWQMAADGDWLTLQVPGGAALVPGGRYIITLCHEKQIMNDAYLKTSISYSHAFAGTYSQGTEWVDMGGYWSKEASQDLDMVACLTGAIDKAVVLYQSAIAASITTPTGATISRIDWRTDLASLFSDAGGGKWSIAGTLDSTIGLANRFTLPVTMAMAQIFAGDVKMRITYAKWASNYVASQDSLAKVEICDIDGDDMADILLGMSGYYSRNELRGDVYRLKLDYTGTETKTETRDVVIDRGNPVPKFVIDPTSTADNAMRLRGGSTASENTWCYTSFSKMSGNPSSSKVWVQFDIKALTTSGTFYVLLNDIHETPEANEIDGIVSASHIVLKFMGGKIYVYTSGGTWVESLAYATDGTTWTTIKVQCLSTSQFLLLVGSASTTYSMVSPIGNYGLGVMEFIAEQDTDVLVDEILTGWDAAPEHFTSPLAPGDVVTKKTAWSGVTGWWNPSGVNSAKIVFRAITGSIKEIPAVYQFTISTFSAHLQFITIEAAPYGTTAWMQIAGTVYNPASYLYQPTWDASSYAEILYHVKVTAVDTKGLEGSDTIVVRLDKTAPAFHGITITPAKKGETDVVSTKASYAAAITEQNTVATVRRELLDETGAYIIDTLDLPCTAGQVSFSLDLFWREFPAIDAVTLRLVATDKAGNSGTTSYALIKDTSTSFTLGGAAAAGALRYGDAITGTVTDSFGMPVTSEPVDVYINQFFYGRAMTGLDGLFTMPFTSLDTFSEDMLPLGLVSAPGSSLMAFKFTGFEFPDALSGSTMPVDVYLLQKAILSDAAETDAAIIQITGTGSSTFMPPDATGLAFDLVIPNVYSDFWHACTFESIEIEFLDAAGVTYTCTIDQEALYEQFTNPDEHPESQQFLLASENLRRIRVYVPLESIKLSGVDMNILSSITIRGKSFSVYTGDIVDYIIDLAAYQFLGIMGLRAVRPIKATSDVTFYVAGHAYLADASSVPRATYALDFDTAADLAEASTGVSTQPGGAIGCITSDAGADGDPGYLRIVGGNPGASTHTQNDNSLIVFPVYDAKLRHADRVSVSVRVPDLYDGKVLASIKFKDIDWQDIINFQLSYSGVMSVNSATIGSYVAGTWHALELRIDWRAKTFDCKLDSTPVITGASFTGEGLASVVITVTSNPEHNTQNMELHVDELALGAPGLGKPVSVIPLATTIAAPALSGTTFEYSDVLPTDDITVIATRAGGAGSIDVRSQRLSFCDVSALSTVAGTETIHRQVTGGELQALAVPGVRSWPLELVYSGNAFFAPVSKTLLLGPFTVVTETPEFTLSTISDLQVMLNDIGQQAPILRVDYGSGQVVGGSGVLVDNDDHNIIFVPGQLGIVQCPLYRFDASTGKWRQPTVVKNDASISNTWSTALGITQTFIATTESITSVAFYTSTSGLPNKLEKIDIYLYDLKDDGTMDLAAPKDHHTFPGTSWGTATGGWHYFDINCKTLVPGKQYAIAVTGSCRHPVTGADMATPVKAALTTGDYLAGKSYHETTGGAWMEDPYVDLAFRIDPYIESAHAFVQLRVDIDTSDDNQVPDPTPVQWIDWQVMELGINGEYAFTVDAAITQTGTGTIAAPASYLPPGVYEARLYYPGTPTYQPAAYPFTLIVSGAQMRLDLVQSLVKTQQATRKSEYRPDGRTYENIDMAQEEDKAWTYLELATTYGDKAEFTFTLTEAESGLPLGMAPVFFEVSLVPNSAAWSDDYFADAPDEYLYMQDPYILPPLDVLQEFGNGVLLQGKYGKPITYPYLTTDLLWARWGPMAWACRITSDDPATRGQVTFSFNKGFLVRHLIQDAQDILKETVNELADVKLYVRVFYSTQVVLEDMALAEGVVTNAYPAVASEVGDTVFSTAQIDDPDDIKTPCEMLMSYFSLSTIAKLHAVFTHGGDGKHRYFAPNREPAYGEGFIIVEKEEIMMAGGYTEGFAIMEDGFDVNIAIMQADTVPGQNGGLKPEGGEPINSNWFDDFTDPGNEIMVYLEVWSGDDTTKFTTYPLYAVPDNVGTVTFTISKASLGGNWDDLLPGIYKGKAWTRGNRFVREFPQTTGYYDFDIVIKSPNSFLLSRPSYEYQFDYAMDVADGVEAFYTAEDPRTQVVTIDGFTGGGFASSYIIITIPHNQGFETHGFHFLPAPALPSGKHWISADHQYPAITGTSLDTWIANLVANINACPDLSGYGIVAIDDQINQAVILQCTRPIDVVAYSVGETVVPPLKVKSEYILPSTKAQITSAIPRISGEVVVVEDGTIDELDEDEVEANEDLPLYDGIELNVSVNGMAVDVERLAVPNPEPAPAYLNEDFYTPLLDRYEFQFSLRPFIGEPFESLKIAFTSLNHLANKHIYLTKLVLDDGLETTSTDTWDLLGEVFTDDVGVLHEKVDDFACDNLTTSDTGAYIADMMQTDPESSDYAEFVPGPPEIRSSLAARIDIDRDTDIDVDHALVLKDVTLTRYGESFTLDRAIKFVHQDKDTIDESLDYSSIEFHDVFGTQPIAPRYLQPEARTTSIWSPIENKLGTGYQFMSIGTSTVPHDFDDSVRHAELDMDTNNDGTNEVVQALYMKPGYIDVQGTAKSSGVAMRFPSVYIPFRPAISGTIALPAFAQSAAVRYAIAIVQVDDPSCSATWHFDINTASATVGTPVAAPIAIYFDEDVASHYSPATHGGISGQELGKFIGKTVDITISVEVNGANQATIDASIAYAHAYWIGLELTGWENFITCSTGLPQTTRAKIFSNRLVNFFALNVDEPKPKSLGLTMQSDSTSEVEFKIVPMEGVASTDPKSLVKVLGLGDHSGGPLDLSSSNWGNIISYFKIGDTLKSETPYKVPDTKAIYLQSLIFPEENPSQPDYTHQTRYYEGKLNVIPYDGTTWTTDGDFTRKISVLMSPFHELRFNTYYHFSMAPSTVDDVEAAYIDFTDASRGLSPLSVNDHDADKSGVVDGDEVNIDDEIVMTYRKPMIQDAVPAMCAADDFAITDWGAFNQVGTPDTTFLASHTVYEADEFYLRRTWELFDWTIASPAPPEGHSVYDEIYRSGKMAVKGASATITPKSGTWARLFGVASENDIDWTKFTLFGYELFVNESIESIDVTLKCAGSSEISWQETNIDATGIIRRVQPITMTGRVEYIRFVVHPKAGYTATPEFTIGSLLFERGSSKITLRATYKNLAGTTASRDFPMHATSPFTSYNWMTYSWTLPSDAAYLTGLAIINPVGTATTRTLDIMSLSIISRNVVTGDVISTIYSHEFSAYAKEAMDLNVDLGMPGAMPIVNWITPGITPDRYTTPAGTTLPYSDDWFFAEFYDFDLSGSMDAVYELTDTSGHAVFEWNSMQNQYGTTFMDFHPIADDTDVLYSTDGEADGIFETEIFITNTEKDIADRANNAAYKQKVEYAELRLDEDTDGKIDYINYQQRQLVSKPCTLDKVTFWNTATSSWKSTTWDYSGQDWQYSWGERRDDNADGVSETDIYYEDRWDDADPNGLERTYETATTTTSQVVHGTAIGNYKEGGYICLQSIGQVFVPVKPDMLRVSIRVPENIDALYTALNKQVPEIIRASLYQYDPIDDRLAGAPLKSVEVPYDTWTNVDNEDGAWVTIDFEYNGLAVNEYYAVYFTPEGANKETAIIIANQSADGYRAPCNYHAGTPLAEKEFAFAGTGTLDTIYMFPERQLIRDSLAGDEIIIHYTKTDGNAATLTRMILANSGDNNGVLKLNASIPADLNSNMAHLHLRINPHLLTRTTIPITTFSHYGDRFQLWTTDHSIVPDSLAGYPVILHYIDTSDVEHDMPATIVDNSYYKDEVSYDEFTQIVIDAALPATVKSVQYIQTIPSALYSGPKGLPSASIASRDLLFQVDLHVNDETRLVTPAGSPAAGITIDATTTMIGQAFVTGRDMLEYAKFKVTQCPATGKTWLFKARVFDIAANKDGNAFLDYTENIYPMAETETMEFWDHYKVDGKGDGHLVLPVFCEGLDSSKTYIITVERLATSTTGASVTFATAADPGSTGDLAKFQAYEGAAPQSLAAIPGADLSYVINTKDADDETRLESTSTTTNLLETRLRFTLLGADGGTTIETDVIIEDSVSVVVDPRDTVVQTARVDSDDGMIAWADPDGDGLYQVGYVFTSETKNDKLMKVSATTGQLVEKLDENDNAIWCPTAIGYFIDINMNQRFDVEPGLMYGGQLNDIFYPTWWLSDYASYTAIRGMAYQDAYDEYVANTVGTAAWWACQILDTAVNTALMILTAGIGYIAANFVYTTFFAPLLHNAIYAALYHPPPEKPTEARAYASREDYPYPNVAIDVEATADDGTQHDIKVAMPRMTIMPESVLRDELVLELLAVFYANKQNYGALEGWLDIMGGLGICDTKAGDFFEGNIIYYVTAWRIRMLDLLTKLQDPNFVAKPTYLRHVSYGWFRRDVDIAEETMRALLGESSIFPIATGNGIVTYVDLGVDDPVFEVPVDLPAAMRAATSRFPNVPGDSNAWNPTSPWIDPFSFYNDPRMPLPNDTGLIMGYQATCLCSAYFSAYAEAQKYDPDILAINWATQLVSIAVSIGGSTLARGVSSLYRFGSQVFWGTFDELITEPVFALTLGGITYKILDSIQVNVPGAYSGSVLDWLEAGQYEWSPFLVPYLLKSILDTMIDEFGEWGSDQVSLEGRFDSAMRRLRVEMAFRSLASGEIDLQGLTERIDRIGDEIGRESESAADYKEALDEYLAQIDELSYTLADANTAMVTSDKLLAHAQLQARAYMMRFAQQAFRNKKDRESLIVAAQETKMGWINFNNNEAGQALTLQLMRAQMQVNDGKLLPTFEEDLIAYLRSFGALPEGKTVKFYILMIDGSRRAITEWSTIFDESANPNVVALVFDDPDILPKGRRVASEMLAADWFNPKNKIWYEMPEGLGKIKEKQMVNYIKRVFRGIDNFKAGQMSKELIKLAERYQIPWRAIDSVIKNLLTRVGDMVYTKRSGVTRWICPISGKIYNIVSDENANGEDDPLEPFVYNIGIRNLLNRYGLDLVKKDAEGRFTMNFLGPLYSELFGEFPTIPAEQREGWRNYKIDLAQRFDDNAIYVRPIITREWLEKFGIQNKIRNVIAKELSRGNVVAENQIMGLCIRAIQRIVDDEVSGRHLPRSIVSNEWMLRADIANIVSDLADKALKGAIGEADNMELNPDGTLKSLQEMPDGSYKGKIINPDWGFSQRYQTHIRGDAVYIEGRYDTNLKEWVFDVIIGEEVKTYSARSMLKYPGAFLNSMFKAIAGMAAKASYQESHGLVAYPSQMGFKFKVPADIANDPAFAGTNIHTFDNFFKLLISPQTVRNDLISNYGAGFGKMSYDDASLKQLIYASSSGTLSDEWGLWRITSDDNLYAQYEAIKKATVKSGTSRISEFRIRIGRIDGLVSTDEDTFLDASGNVKWKLDATGMPELLLDTFPTGRQAYLAGQLVPRVEALPHDSTFYRSITANLWGALFNSPAPGVKIPPGYQMTPRLENYFHIEPEFMDPTSSRRGIEVFRAIRDIAQRSRGIFSDVIEMKLFRRTSGNTFGMTEISGRRFLGHPGSVQDWTSNPLSNYPESDWIGMDVDIPRREVQRSRLAMAPIFAREGLDAELVLRFRNAIQRRLGVISSSQFDGFLLLADLLSGGIFLNGPSRNEESAKGIFFEACHYQPGDQERVNLPPADRPNTVFTELLYNLGLSRQESFPRAPNSVVTGDFCMTRDLDYKSHSNAVLTPAWIDMIEAFLRADYLQFSRMGIGIFNILKKMFPIDEAVWNQVMGAGGDVDQFIGWLRSVLNNKDPEYLTRWDTVDREDLFLTDPESSGKGLTTLANGIIEGIQYITRKLLNAIPGIATSKISAISLDFLNSRDLNYLAYTLLKAFYGDWHEAETGELQYDLLIQYVVDKILGNTILDDLSDFARINRMMVDRNKIRQIGNYLWAELYRKMPNGNTYRMLVRMPINRVDFFVSGVDVCYVTEFDSYGKPVNCRGPSAFFDNIPDGDDAYQAWVLGLIQSGKLKTGVINLWALMSSALNPLLLN
nr:hypothetical protein [Candidatus Sigynarchaeota archaeon]